ncbi:cysteine desulfurase [Cytobacillus suaedae]|nr:cysteine desulfurase [Cytobacillus suaedae]
MIYLDNSATTLPYDEVLDVFMKVSKEYFGNPSSIHRLGSNAERLLTQARENVAKILGCRPSEIIFTSGGSEGNNLAIKGVALFNKRRGNHIITSSIEHPSVEEACKQLEGLGFEVTYVKPDENGVIHIENIKNALRNETILVSIMHVNNEIGTIQPIEEIGKLLRDYPKVLFHVDHVQGVGKVPLHFPSANIDLCTISGHKFHGIKGTGILYVRSGVELTQLISGGNQENRYRSGTENTAGAVALSKALRMTFEDIENKISKMNIIKRSFIDKLSADVPLISINTPNERSAPHIINFSINGLKSGVFVHMLEEQGIYVSTTSACSSKKQAPSKTLLAMGKDEKTANSSIRISLTHFNKVEDVDIVINAIRDSLTKLEKIMR